MAPSFSLLSLLSLLTTTLFLAANTAPVDDVCNQTKDPPCCIKSITYDSSVKNEPLENIPKIAIEFSHFRASSIKTNIESLVKKVMDPKVKTHYDACEKIYNGTILPTFKAAKVDLTGKRYPDVEKKAGDILAAVESCEAEFNNKSPWNGDSKVVEILVDALGVAAKLLEQMNFS